MGGVRGSRGATQRRAPPTQPGPRQARTPGGPHESPHPPHLPRYHNVSSDLLTTYLNASNPDGVEPIPENALANGVGQARGGGRGRGGA